MHGATHLPYNKEDEGGAQHQSEHVAEGREGERHGCASQPDDEIGREGEREPPSSTLLSTSLLDIAHSLFLLVEVIVCFPLWCEPSLFLYMSQQGDLFLALI